jgi:hypothetical protein
LLRAEVGSDRQHQQPPFAAFEMPLVTLLRQRRVVALGGFGGPEISRANTKLTGHSRASNNGRIVRQKLPFNVRFYQPDNVVMQMQRIHTFRHTWGNRMRFTRLSPACLWHASGRGFGRANPSSPAAQSNPNPLTKAVRRSKGHYF